MLEFLNDYNTELIEADGATAAKDHGFLLKLIRVKEAVVANEVKETSEAVNVVKVGILRLQKVATGLQAVVNRFNLHENADCSIIDASIDAQSHRMTALPSRLPSDCQAGKMVSWNNSQPHVSAAQASLSGHLFKRIFRRLARRCKVVVRIDPLLQT